MRLDHVGIAVRDLEDALALYTTVFGGRLAHREDLAADGVRVAFVEAGGIWLELLAPLDPAGPLARFLQSRGEGLHHLAFEVPDVGRALREVATAGQRLVDAQPRRGTRGRLIAFLHPSTARGVLIELVQAQGVTP